MSSLDAQADGSSHFPDMYQMNYEDLVTDYLERVDRGEHSDPQEYISRHPQYADRLKRFFANLGVMNDVVEKISPAPPSESNLASSGKTIGDFRIIRELGRGGMGIVYEAEQLSTERRVALKTLPLAGLVDESRIKRFRNEVRAVAALDHPNIVTVHTVGEERGVHYFAMQLIRGRSLSEIVLSLKRVRDNGSVLDGDSVNSAANASVEPDSDSAAQQTEAFAGALVPEVTRALAAEQTNSALSSSTGNGYFRSIVAIGVQAASALQHAHDQGVIHRDIKPANLLLDASSNLYVTDFGLARIETDAGMTVTGSILGTLRYMAPEQALAKRVTIDHRADIYSLGVTLYELLSLQPAYSGADRQQLLKQIAFEDPKPLRRVNSKIPVELEVIVQKAMSKDMDDRYSTSQALADDLRCFLEHRPITARTPTAAQRIGKWTRRNPILVWATIITLASIVLSLAGSTLLVMQQRDKVAEMSESQRTGLYTSETHLAYLALADGNSLGAMQLLSRHIPNESKTDLRGLEWYYLAGRCNVNSKEFISKTAGWWCLCDNSKYICTIDKRDLIVIDLDTEVRSVVLPAFSDSYEWVRDAAFSPVGVPGQRPARVAVTTSDGVRIIDLTTKQIVAVAGKTRRPVALSGDGKWGASAQTKGDEIVVQLWDAVSGEIEWERPTVQPESLDEHLFVLEFSPSSKHLVAAHANANSISAWDVLTGDRSEIPIPAKKGVRDVAFVDDHEFLVAARSGVVSATLPGRDITSGAGTSWLPDARDITSLSLSPDRSRIAIGKNPKRVEVWDLETKELVLHQLWSSRIEQVRFSGDGTELLLNTKAGIERCEIDDPTTSKLGPVSYNHWPGLVASHNETIALAGRSHQLILWESARDTTRVIDFAEDTPNPTDCYLKAVAFSPDGSRVAAGGHSDGIIRIWDVESGQIENRLPTGPETLSLAYSQDGGFLASGEHEVTLWDMATGEVRWQSPERVSTTALCFSPDGKWLASGGGNWHKDGAVALWNVQGDFPRLTQEFAHDEIVFSFAISPDSRWLAAGDMSGTLVVYDLQNQEAAIQIGAHSMAINSLAFAPDGGALVSGSLDSSAKFWQVGSWTQLGIVRLADPVECVRFLNSKAGRVGILFGTSTGGTNPSTQHVHWINSTSKWDWMKSLCPD